VNPLFAAAVELQAFFSSLGWRSTVIGGLAVLRWGEPRQTRDVDLALFTGLGGESRFIDAILARYRGRVPDARGFALQHRVVLIETERGVPVDISLAGISFEMRLIERSTPFAITPGVTFVTCSAEDLVVLKAFAGRIQDWLDIEGIIVRQTTLDRALVLEELRPLLELKDDEAAATRLLELFRKHPPDG
jgi:hypothetical protein